MNKQILKLALPNIISNVSVPLLSTVDTALMGHLSALHLGAVGLGSMIFNFVYWNFGFLRMGTTGLTAQAFGRKDSQSIRESLFKSLIFSLVIAVILILGRYPLTDLSIYLMNVNPDQVDLVRQYMLIRFWAAPATLSLYGLLGWFFGMQNAFIPLVITVSLNAMNILVSYLLIVQFNYDIDGVAIGTVVAQYFGLAIALLFLIYKYKDLLFKSNKIVRLDFDSWLKFLSLNKDIFIRTLFLTFVFAFFYSQSSGQGAVLLAVNVILLQMINWMAYGIDGFAFAAESIVGKYYGAKDKFNFNHALRLIFLWGFGSAAVFSISYILFSDFIIQIFTNDNKVLFAARDFIIWMSLLPVLAFGSYIWDGIYIGITAVRAMRNSMFLSFIIFFATFYLTRPHLGPHSLWLSLTVFLLVRGVIQYVLYKKKGWDLA